MRAFLFVFCALAALLGLVAGILFLAGTRLPSEHRSVVTARFKAGRNAVWAVITDYAALPRWWPAVRSIRFETLADGTVITWNLDRRGHEIPFRTIESRAPERLVRRIARDDLPFGGTWTFVLTPTPEGGTELSLTEDGVIRPPFFRAVARWFIGLDATQKDFVAHLEKHLARDGQP